MSPQPSDPVPLTDAQRAALVASRVACPFLGSAVAEKRLAVLNSADDPLASIEEVRRLGDLGGGDLGKILVLFATGNHAFLRGADGRLDRPVPDGLFSLELAGSQGAHPGHSGILMGDPATPGSGRFSAADFDRLAALAVAGRIRRSDVGRFIADNLRRDPKAKVADLGVAKALLADFAALVAKAFALTAAFFGAGERSMATRALAEAFTKLAGEDNLIGSAGEFGLLFAFLSKKPGSVAVDGEPTIALADVESMFVAKALPPGFETWEKSAAGWLEHTLALAGVAAREFHRRPETNGRPTA